MIEIFCLLLVGHAIADYPLQGDFLSKAKNRAQPIAGVPWYQGLIAHSLIHAGFVGVLTGSITLGAAEFVAHCLIDDAKCFGRISYDTDQALHVLCKVFWILTLLLYGPLP
ncbi:hypothetical protein MesoLjLc_50990 [Mesorhizobium sp. L-8-10]|uniref:DUF3307 domain-containing protein n=1 Tax=Mesorhizobium sp. L-8-10 TaxID=2744523 RepID=UPI0019279823|nr:DUF3307 domain-containing protein [Mesorhizobium sp. L-8-10]BCH33169.1 hypothetical protein MesoLjLc_50990 [Mesorhizobium sp. L-8-10]